MSTLYGQMTDGRKVLSVRLQNTEGLALTICTYGARILDLSVPDRHGVPGSVVLGYASLEDYRRDPMFFGAAIGRVAGRITNAEFSMGQERYRLDDNDPPNCLHGGSSGFHSRLWDIVTEEPDRVVLGYVSPAGENGFPGELTVYCEYALGDSNEVRLTMQGVSNHPTPFSPTNHSYFNLSGKPGTTIDEHELTINAGRYTPFDESFALTLGAVSVAGSPADFRRSRRLGAAVPEQIRQHGENYLLNGAGSMKEAAVLRHPPTGRVLTVSTTSSCLQFFGGHLIPGGLADRYGMAIPPRAAICLECQEFPDGANQTTFGSIILDAGEEYLQRTVWSFGCD